MKTKNRKPDVGWKERGFVLITIYMLLPIFLILGGSLMTYSLTDVRLAQRSQDAAQAFYLAEAAIDEGYTWLREQAGPPGGTEALVLNDGWQETLGGGYYMAIVDPDDNNPNSYIKRYTIQGLAVGDNYQAARQANLVVQIESFARYAYLSDNEISTSGSTVWFRTGDHIEGPTHTNGQFSMYGSPTFDGLVSSVSDSINYYNPAPSGGNNPNFNEGLELGAEEREYPSSIPSNVLEAATASSAAYTGTTTVTLVSDGTLQITTSTGTVETRPIPDNGVLYVNGDMYLSGTLHGQLTVAASGDIEITNSVTYADDPETNPESEDLLGILAGGNVKVSSAAPTNVTIDASIMALSSSFTVENYWVGPAKGTLTVYGGINQARRGPVGTFYSSTGTMASGYTKSYHYDERLRNMIPPYFPLTGNYNTLGWEDASK